MSDEVRRSPTYKKEEVNQKMSKKLVLFVILFLLSKVTSFSGGTPPQ